MITRSLLKGLAAGAAGTTALNAATYTDMAVRGRPSSEMPEKAVETLSGRAGYEVPGEGETRENRLEGLGALGGIATGLGIGLVAAVFGPVVRRLPLPVAAAFVGGLAMAGSDVPMIRSGLTDPKTWSTADWASDAVPHFVYGLVTAWTLRALHDGRRRQAS